jgi:hypothetical protein
MLRSPQMRGNGMQLFTAAVAGPALVVAGLRYPGAASARAALVLMGTVLVAYNTQALTREVKPLLTKG